MTLDEILAVAEFLGDSMTDDQASRLMDECRQLSIEEREVLMDCTTNSTLYNVLSINRYECRWEAL